MKILKLTVCIGGLLLGGCSLFRPAPVAPPPAPPPPPPPVPQLPQPSATDRAAVETGHDIVGHVHNAIVGKEDTRPDIARRFDVGYEEMLTANPGVDP